jgi:D-cysteine desulfhydrase
MLETLATPLGTHNLKALESPTAIIFAQYPLLSTKLPYIPLASLPTPLQKLSTLSRILSIPNFYIKRDDLTSTTASGTYLFGGNKTRKLEFVLADAIYHRAKSVMTFGGVGSNHAAATAIYAHYLGLSAICLLKDQPNSVIVQRNLLLMHRHGAMMHWFPSMTERNAHALTIFLEHKNRHGNFPYVIPPGASTPLGAVGYVNAALELKEQIDQCLMPMPDYIYVAVGSMGTISGLLLGCKLAKIPAKIIGINTDPETSLDEINTGIKKLFNETNLFLNKLDSSIPLHTIDRKEIVVLNNFCGEKYGLCTLDGAIYRDILKSCENILLDSTYTAKAFAGMIHHTYITKTNKSVILFWHTWDSSDFVNVDPTMYRNLPHKFHPYFEHSLQFFDMQ